MADVYFEYLLCLKLNIILPKIIEMYLEVHKELN